MGVFNNIKSSITGSDSSSDFESGDLGSSTDNSGLGDSDLDLGSQNSGTPNPQNGNNSPPGNDPLGDSQANSPGERNPRGSRRNSNIPSSDGQGNPNAAPSNSPPTGNQGPGSSRKGAAGSPNPQSGRPREGDTSPQVSNRTQREIENAGLTRPKSDGRNSKQSVADRKDGFEELKSQNEQIIELLKRINRSLNSGRHGGRR